MRLFAALVLLMGLSGAAEAACVNTRTLGGHKVIDDNTIDFKANGRRVYRVTTRGCRATQAERLSIQLTSSYMCTGDLITLLDSQNNYRGRCVIAGIVAQ